MHTHIKKHIVAATLVGVMGLAMAGPSLASAHSFGFGGFGGQSALTADQIASKLSTHFASQATLIGATAEEVKTAWANGTKFEDFALSKGVSKEQLRTKMQEAKLVAMKTQLQSLVSQGVITQAQADKRLETIKNFKPDLSKKGQKGVKGERPVK